MLDIKDFSSFEDQASFDFKGLLIKLEVTGNGFSKFNYLHHSLSGQIFAKGVYSMETLISVKKQSLFTSNTSLVFNWGGTSDQFKLFRHDTVIA
jgi:hypothetical protein